MAFVATEADFAKLHVGSTVIYNTGVPLQGAVEAHIYDSRPGDEPGDPPILSLHYPHQANPDLPVQAENVLYGAGVYRWHLPVDEEPPMDTSSVRAGDAPARADDETREKLAAALASQKDAEDAFLKKAGELEQLSIENEGLRDELAIAKTAKESAENALKAAVLPDPPSVDQLADLCFALNESDKKTLNSKLAALKKAAAQSEG